MALKWLNRLSSLLQHLFDLTAIKNRNDNDDGVEDFDAVFFFFFTIWFIRIYSYRTILFLLVEPYLTAKLTYLK